MTDDTGDSRIDEAVERLETVASNDLAGRLDAGEHLHQVLTDRMSQTGGRDGG